ncbi:MAG TPA: aldehyde dehydrogenase family protein [Rhizobiaceae bacterium]|nr:aldehyde dehydrogenase family protein [Rhizobiaceae bacterium]
MSQAMMLIAGAWRKGTSRRQSINPYDGSIAGNFPESQPLDLEDALAAAVTAKASVAATPALQRGDMLRRAAVLITERAEAISQLMTAELGKPIRDSRIEVGRCAPLLMMCAEEAVRIEGDKVPIDGHPNGDGKLAVMWRFPVGVVAGITPFNAPFNLAWHKVAPAIAAGNSVVLKAPAQGALVVNELARIIVDAGIPAGWVNVLYGDTVGPMLASDPRVDFISFTGSARVGELIKSTCGLKRVALELGGTGPTIVHADADIDVAAPTCALNATRLAGQSCLSVQNLYIHSSRYDAFVDAFVKRIRALKVGNPVEEDTDIGTLINERSADRIEGWIKEAVAGGAHILTGSGRKGAQFEPTVIANAHPGMKVVDEEIFGPVAVVHRYGDFDAVLAQVNDTPYGLHCGLFTNDMKLAFKAIRALRFGGVVVNGSSTWRTDQMPYGGIKNSGIGREGPRYAIRDMTDERLVIFNL